MVEHRGYADRHAFDAALAAAIDASEPDLVVLAGFMRVLGAAFVARYAGRMLNIHPSLLPAYPGLHTHRRALADGVRIHGCTVHFVTADVDHGPIVVQGAVAVHADDDEATLAARVLAVEHRLLPAAVRAFCEGRLVIAGRGCALRARWRPRPPSSAPLPVPSPPGTAVPTGAPALDSRAPHDHDRRRHAFARARPRWIARLARERPRRGLVIALALSLALHLALSLWPVEVPTTRRRRAAAGDDHRDAAAPRSRAGGRREAPPKAAPRDRAAGTRCGARARRDDRGGSSARSSPRRRRSRPARNRRPRRSSPPSPQPRRPPPSFQPKTLPRRVDLVYTVFLGTHGFVIGDATYRFEHAANEYRIATVGEARGLAALLIRGQGKVESRGLITRGRPAAAGVLRSSAAAASGARRPSSTGSRASSRCTTKDRGARPAHVRSAVADVAGLLLAAGRRHADLSVATTRRLGRYSITREGTELIQWPHGEIETERWHRRSDDGKTDGYVWLAPSLHYIPVKMRVAATNRGTLEALLDSIRVDEATPEQ